MAYHSGMLIYERNNTGVCDIYVVFNYLLTAVLCIRSVLSAALYFWNVLLYAVSCGILWITEIFLQEMCNCDLNAV